MYNENNVNVFLDDMYISLTDSNNQFVPNHKINILYNTLRYINDNYDGFNNDEIIICKNILKASKYMLSNLVINNVPTSQKKFCDSEYQRLKKRINDFS